MRNEIIYFLNQQKRDKKRKATKQVVVAHQGLEKVSLEIGFIPLTDCAPLVVAKEKGFFKKHGLEVNLCRETNWSAIASGIATERLDAAQMVAGMPLSMTIGMDGNQSLPIVTSLVLSRNGNAITLSKEFYEQGVRTLSDFKRLIAHTEDRIFNLGIVHPSSMHNLMLRYWLASVGIDPDRDVNLTVIPPPHMATHLKAGKIDGYCVGEPWNSLAVNEGIGFIIATDLDIWPGNPDKVLGVSEDWVNQNPQTHIALVKALIEACQYCDDPRNREGIVQLLCQSQYLGPAQAYTRPGFIDPYNRGTEEKPQMLPRFNQFYVDNSNCPGRVEGLWLLTQLARWGITPFPKNWIEILERVRRVDLFGEAARQLGLPDIESDRESFTLFDGMVFNPDDPMGYLKHLDIRHEIQVKEIIIDAKQTEAA